MMTRRGGTSDERLRTLLREADPALDDPGLTPEERAGVRSLTRTESVSARVVRRSWVWLPIGATALLLLVVVAAAHDLKRGWWSTPAPEITISAPVAVRDSPQVRQIHLTTKNGTRVIWILNPEASF